MKKSKFSELYIPSPCSRYSGPDGFQTVQLDNEVNATYQTTIVAIKGKSSPGSEVVFKKVVVQEHQKLVVRLVD